MKRLVIFTVLALVLSPGLFAGEGDIGPVTVERLGVIGVATGGHLAGNMEVKIKNNFTLPAGVVCDKSYITTKRTSDPNGAMMSLLMKVQTTSQPVYLRITDNPSYTAYSGRCSLVLVDLR